MRRGQHTSPVTGFGSCTISIVRVSRKRITWRSDVSNTSVLNMHSSHKLKGCEMNMGIEMTVSESPGLS